MYGFWCGFFVCLKWEMKCVKYLLDIVCCFLFGLGSLLEKVSCFISTPDFFFFFFLFMFHITFLFLCFSSLRQIISGKNEEKKRFIN